MGGLAERAVAALAGAAMLAGCGAGFAVRDARTSFDQAKAAGAEKAAPYPYYAAEAYLELAEHEAGEVDGRAAREFAQKSQNYSAMALERARGGAK